MRILLSAFFTAALLPVPAARAEEPRGASIATPSLGLVYDSTAAIRRISGTAGAATLGEPLDPGFPVAKAVVSGERHYVLAISADDGQVRVVQFYGKRAIATVMGDALTSAARMTLSPSGQAAVLYDDQSSRLQVIRGLPDDPVVSQEFSTVNLGNAATDPAVSDDGSRVLFAADSLWLFDAESGLAQVPAAFRVAAISFRHGMQEALAASDGGELYRIEATGTVSFFGRAISPGAVPVAVQMSADGTRGYVAFNDGLLAAIDTKREETKYLPCQCTPTGLKTLNASGMFAVNDVSPLRLFDISGSEPRLWFVPLDRTGTEAVGSAQ